MRCLLKNSNGAIKLDSAVLLNRNYWKDNGAGGRDAVSGVVLSTWFEPNIVLQIQGKYGGMTISCIPRVNSQVDDSEKLECLLFDIVGNLPSLAHAFS